MKSSYWLSAGVYSILERISALVFAFGATIMLFHVFSKENMGVWTQFMSVATFIEVGRIGLLSNTMMRFRNTTEATEYPKIQSAAIVLSVVLALISGLILLFFSTDLENLLHAPNLSSLLLIYALTTLLLTPLYQFMFLLQASMNLKGVFFMSFMRQSIFFFFVLFYYNSKKELHIVDLAVVQCIAVVPATIVGWYFARHQLAFDKLDWAWVRKIFHYGKFTFGTNASTMFYKKIDGWMISSLLTAGASAPYSLAVQISSLAEVPTTALAQIMFPKAAMRMAEEGKEAVCNLYEKSVGVILSLVIPFMIFVWIFADLIVTILSKGRYPEAVPLLRVAIASGFFVPFAIQFGTILDSTGRPQINFYFTLLGALLSLIFNFLLISKFGVVGAAYGILCAYILMFVLMQFFLHRYIGVKTWRVFTHIIPFYKTMFLKIKSLINKQ